MLDAILLSTIPLDVSRSIQGFTARVALARRMSQSFGVAPSADADETVDAEILADTWRRAANSTIETLDALNVAIAGGGRPASAASLPMSSTINLLRRAADGETTCIDPMGRVTIPGWAERRREPRLLLDLEATIVVGKILFKVRIRDASPTGLGIEGRIVATIGERLVVKYRDRQLSGVVAWIEGDRLGLNLDQRLEAGDHLLHRN